MNVFTRIRFRILPPLYELNRAIITVRGEHGDCAVRFTITPSRSSQAAETGGNATVPGDDLGALHNTIVEVEIPAGLATSPRDQRPVAEAQAVAVDLLNLVIEHYRDVTGTAQIRRVPTRHARAFLWEQLAEGGSIQSGRCFGGSGLQPDGPPAESLASGDPEIVAAIQASVLRGRLPVWASLYLDALADFYTDNTRSGLVHLYMSLEMLANETCQRLGEAAVGAEAATAFLAPAAEDPPVVHAVLKRTREWADSGPSKSAISRLIRSLWRNRNDLLHGRPVELPPDIVETSLVTFGELAAWLQAARPASRALRPR